jgi:hypothetical protein
MSLVNPKQKNIIRPINYFADGSDFGVTKTGELVRIVKTSTWAGVFENGLSVNKQYELETCVRTSESVIPVIKSSNIVKKVDYDDLLSIIDELDYKTVKVLRGSHPFTSTSSAKQRAKTARSRTKHQWSIERHVQRLEPELDCSKVKCKCYSCTTNRKYIIKLDTCSCCGTYKPGDVKHYNSVFLKKGSLMCSICAKYECCPGCGWDAGGICKYCKHSFSW